ncbi:unnamed protein product [Rotaria sp. Silwood1]|nr:unnamed protein product [Rotaria sp. Silwood1]
MFSTNILFRLVLIFEFLSNFKIQSICYIHDDEILCKAPEFYHYNSSSINNNIIRSSQILHLINAYYSGNLIENINKLIIDDYPYKIFPSPFISINDKFLLYVHNHVGNIFKNVCSICWLISLTIASLPLINVNNFHSNSLCVPFRVETVFDRFYLSLLVIFDVCFIGIIITCNGLICFNFSKSHVHTLNDARATLKILTLVVAICISRIPLIIFIFVALIIHPTYSFSINDYSFNFNDFKLVILFLQPFSSCFNPFMYSSLSTLKWTRTKTGFERPKSIKRTFEFSRFRSTSVVSNRGYHPLRMMSISSLDYRLSSSPNTP